MLSGELGSDRDNIGSNSMAKKAFDKTAPGRSEASTIARDEDAVDVAIYDARKADLEASASC